MAYEQPETVYRKTLLQILLFPDAICDSAVYGRA
jgi:hypothetical protein